MRNRFSLLLGLIALIAIAMPSGAQAEWQTQDCANGVLVGFTAKAGVWVDRIGAICRPWNSSAGTLGDPVDQPLLATSGGGSPQRVQCPDGFAIIQLDHHIPTINGQNVAEQITLTCQNVFWPHNGSATELVIRTTGDLRSDNDSCGFPPGVCTTGTKAPLEVCEVGQIATGFQANVAQFVGQIKLHCALWPTKDTSTVARRAAIYKALRSATDTAPVPGSSVIEGEWRTSEGTMTLSQNNRLDGTYSKSGGTLMARNMGGSWDGFWFQTTSGERCSRPRQGTDYWGQLSFSFSDQNRHFDGIWSYCDDAPGSGGKWTGDRIK